MKKRCIPVLAFATFLILAFIAFRGLLFKSGTLGHSWDWLIPSRSDYLQGLFFSSFSTWQATNLGESRLFQLSAIPFNVLFFSFSFLGLTGDFISKFLVISTIVLSGWGMFFFLTQLQEKTAPKTSLFPPLMGGIFYAFSPFLFAEFIGGATTQFFSYSLVPWLFYFVLKINNSQRFKVKYLLIAALFLSFITISLQVLVLSFFLLAFYSLAQVDRVKYLFNLFLISLVYLFFNSYWILPTFFEFTSFARTVFASSFFDPTHLKFNVPSLPEIFLGTGYWRPIFMDSISPALRPVWAGIIYLFVAFILFSNLLIRKRRESVFWVLILLVSFIFATGGKEPLGDQVLWLYFHIPLMSLFRSPQHFLVVPIFAFGVLIGLSLESLLFRRRILLKVLVFAVLLFWLHPFFIDGQLRSTYLLKAKKDHVGVFCLTDGYEKSFNFLKIDKDPNFRVLFLPMSSSPRYLKTQCQDEGQGSDPLVTYSPYGSLVSDINYNQKTQEVAKVLENYLYERKNIENVDKLSSYFGFKYLVIRHDVLPEFSDKKEIWSATKISEYLSQNTRIRKVFSDEYIELFQNLSYSPELLIYPATSTTLANYNPNLLFDGAVGGFEADRRSVLISHEVGNKFNNVILEPAPYLTKWPEKINHRNTFRFKIEEEGSYSLKVREDDYREDFNADPFNPFSFVLDGKEYSLEKKEKDRGWLDFGAMDLQKGDHELVVKLPSVRSLLEVDSWRGYYPPKEGRIDKVSFGPLKPYPSSLYKISLTGKTIAGEPPHFIFFQDTDITQEKRIPKLERFMEKKLDPQYYEVIFSTNVDTTEGNLLLVADPSAEGDTEVFFEDIKVERLFNSPLILAKEKKEVREIPPPDYFFKKISPTKYEVFVKQSEDPFFLIFSQSFSPFWKLSIGDDSKTLSEDKHVLANFFANGWFVEEKGSYKLTIEFSSQRLFEIGGLISILSFIFVAFLSLREKDVKKNH